jgi:transposase
MDEPLTLFGETARVVRKRTRRDPRPRFKPDRSAQLDAVMGCPELIVPRDHVSRAVRSVIDAMDLSCVETKFSSLGRHGYQPKHKLAVLVLGSIQAVHSTIALERSTRTDAAFRLVAGGYVISAGTLRRFRLENAELFAHCIEQVVRMAVEQGLVDATELAVDGMRLHAHAARKSVRTEAHASKRLDELRAMEPSTLSPEQRVERAEKIDKHESTLSKCAQQGRSSIVTTSPSAGFMKFPTGEAGPGHRITVTAAGASVRLVVAVLVDAESNDYGKLRPALEQARAVLLAAGICATQKLQATADAGYTSEADLAFAERSQSWVDVLANVAATPHSDAMTKGHFSREKFVQLPDGKLRCPAGTTMRGPIHNGDGRLLYRGVGCETCPLRSQCTDGKQRSMTIAPRLDQLRGAMRARLEEPEGRARYRKRMATVEPVFSYLQDRMKFRRSSSRHTDGVVAEILLKILAYNIARLATAKRMRLFVFEVHLEF